MGAGVVPLHPLVYVFHKGRPAHQVHHAAFFDGLTAEFELIVAGFLVHIFANKAGQLFRAIYPEGLVNTFYDSACL